MFDGNGLVLSNLRLISTNTLFFINTHINNNYNFNDNNVNNFFQKMSRENENEK